MWSSWAFDTVRHDVLIGKLRKCELDEQMVSGLRLGCMAYLRGLSSVAQGLVGGLRCPPGVSTVPRSGQYPRTLCCHSEESQHVGVLVREEASEIQ